MDTPAFIGGSRAQAHRLRMKLQNRDAAKQIGCDLGGPDRVIVAHEHRKKLLWRKRQMDRPPFFAKSSSGLAVSSFTSEPDLSAAR